MTPDFSRYERIVATRNGRILTLTLTAPNPVNAVDGEMHHELSRIFLDAQDDPDSDLIVLTGAGRAFCAGGDTAWFKTHIEDPGSFRAIGPEAKRIITSLLDLEKPLLCRLNGAAAGLGATIALMCDVIIASDKAVVGDPHVKVGLVAGDGGAAKSKRVVRFESNLTRQSLDRIPRPPTATDLKGGVTAFGSASDDNTLFHHGRARASWHWFVVYLY